MSLICKAKRQELSFRFPLKFKLQLQAKAFKSARVDTCKINSILNLEIGRK